LFDVVEDLVHAFLEDRPPRYAKEALQEQCRAFVGELLQERDAFVFQRQHFFLQELGVNEPQLVG
jgi:hypothetical protein